MRVAHVNVGGPRTRVDGVAVAVDLLVEAQQARGARTRVVRDRSEWPDLLAWRPQVVHFHSAFRPAHVWLATGLRRLGVPYVVSPHSALSEGSLSRQTVRKRGWIWLFDRRLLASAATVFCLTEVEARDIRRFAPSASVAVVPNIAVQSPAAWPPARLDRPRIVTLARFDVYQKGLDRLAGIAAALPEMDFVVHGDFDGNDRAAARRLIAARPPNLAFRDAVSGSAKERVFTSASLYLQPSRWEGMSMAVIEAMIRGVPCAVSQYVGATLGESAREICLVLPDDPALAAERISEILAEPDRLSRIGAAAREWAASTLSPARIGDLCLELYQRAASPQRASHPLPR